MHPIEPPIRNLRDSRRLLQLAQFRDPATGQVLAMEGNVNARKLAKMLVDSHREQPNRVMWRVADGLWCVVQLGRHGELKIRVADEDVKAAKEITHKIEWPCPALQLQPHQIQLRRHQFTLVHRDGAGAWKYAPPAHFGRAGTGPPMLAIRVLEGELEMVQEQAPIGQPATVLMARQANDAIPAHALVPGAPVGPVAATVDELLKAAVAQLDGLPHFATVAGYTIRLVPLTKVGFDELPDSMNVADLLDVERMLPLALERAQSHRPFEKYAVIAQLLGLQLDPKCHDYKTTVSEAFSREWSEVKGRMLLSRWTVDREQSTNAYLSDGTRTKQWFFRRLPEE